MDLLLVRHGHTQRIVGAAGPADPGLTPEGLAQAETLAAWLVDEDLDRVYTSPLRRARETAAPVARAVGVEVRVDDGLAEWDREADTYIPIEELRGTSDPRWQELVTGEWTTIEGDPVSFQRSVVESIEAIIDENPSRRVAAICHGGVINAYLAHVLGTASPLFFEPAYTSVSRVRAARSGERSVVSINETGHLR
jgi:probable phosphoglycerate mutase